MIVDNVVAILFIFHLSFPSATTVTSPNNHFYPQALIHHSVPLTQLVVLTCHAEMPAELVVSPDAFT